MKATVRRWLPFLDWPRLTFSLARNDALAAITVAVVMVPQSVAYAQLAGMPLVAGLYATFLPMLAAVLWSSSTRLSTGPSALTSVLVGASLLSLAAPGSGEWVSLAVWLALIAGAVQFAIGALGGAWVMSLVTSPVLSGFSQAAALLIIASQLPALIGLNGPLESLLRPPRAVDLDSAALVFGLSALALFVLGKRFAPRVPVVLAGVAIAAVVAKFSGYADDGGAVVGTLPAGLPSLYLPTWPGFATLGALVAPALVIVLVSSLEMASSAKIESARDGRRWDAGQDLVGQGVGKLVSALSGGFATSTSFSRSALTLASGARTGWATAFAALVVLAVLLFLTPALALVPRAVLAAVVVAAVAGLVKPSVFARLWRVDRVEAATAGVAFAVTLAASPRIYWGVVAGVLMALAHFLYRRLHPRIIEVGLHPDGSLRDRHLWHLPPLASGLYALRMDAELDFASADTFERTLLEHLAAHPATRHVCLFAQPINRVDATGAEAFARVATQLAASGITLHISGLKLPAETVLRRAGALVAGPPFELYRTDTDALLAFGRLSA